MHKFSKQLTLPCNNGADAIRKLLKLMRRGCMDDGLNTNTKTLSPWHFGCAAKYSGEPCNLIIHRDGQVLIAGHEGSGIMIERVRDVENYRV